MTLNCILKMIYLQNDLLVHDAKDFTKQIQSYNLYLATTQIPILDVLS